MADGEISARIFVYFAQVKQRQLQKRNRIRKVKAKLRFNVYTRRRRRAFALLFMQLMMRVILQHVPVREQWKRPRLNSFWEETCQGWTEREWRENLRMSRTAFEFLCRELSPNISRRYTNFRKAIPVRQRFAITLYRLADTAQYRIIANLFGVGKSTVCQIVKEVCQAIVEILMPTYIRLPRACEVQGHIAGFRRRAGFPQVVAALDACHIPIIAPEESPEDFVNRKGFHWVLLQALVDSRYRFMDITVGWPGRAHHSRMFKNSPYMPLHVPELSCLGKCPR